MKDKNVTDPQLVVIYIELHAARKSCDYILKLPHFSKGRKNQDFLQDLEVAVGAFSWLLCLDGAKELNI